EENQVERSCEDCWERQNYRTSYAEREACCFCWTAFFSTRKCNGDGFPVHPQQDPVSRLYCEYVRSKRLAETVGLLSSVSLVKQLLSNHNRQSMATQLKQNGMLTRRHFMYNAIPLSLAALIAAGIIVIGCFYLVSPERISGSFGLKPPASDADTRAWL